MRVPKPPIWDPFANDSGTQADADLFNEPSYLVEGFPAPGGLPVRPPLGYFNWLFYMTTAAARYLFQRGISDWDENETNYEAFDIVRDPIDLRFYVLMSAATPGVEPSTDPAWICWLASPAGSSGAYAKEVWAWMNAKQHRGFGIDHQGLPAGPFFQLTEAWEDGGMVQKTGADVADIGGGVFGASGAWAGRWNYMLRGNHADLGLFANGPWVADLTTHPRGPIVGAFPRVGTQASAVVVEAAKPWLIMPETFCSLEAQFSVNPASGSGTSEDESFAWGIGDGTLVGTGSVDEIAAGSAVFPGAYFYRGYDGTTWHARSRTPGGANIDTDTGVAFAENVPLRGRIEITGVNGDDLGGGGARVVRFYINGAIEAEHAHSLVNAKIVPFLRAQSLGSTIKHGLNLGPMRFTARHLDGPTTLI